MRYPTCLTAAGIILHVCAPVEAAPPGPFSISVTCPANPHCTFDGSRIPINIVMRNDSGRDILLTVLYLKNAGPAVKITDRDTKRHKYLHARLGDESLLGDYQMIAPGSEIILTDVITKTEILSFQKNAVDIEVEIAFDARWKHPDGQSFVLAETGNFRIVGADRVDTSEDRPAKSQRK